MKIQRFNRWRWLSGGFPRPTPLGPRGFIVFLVVIALLYASTDWLRRDPKFTSTMVLNAALYHVLSRGVLEASPEEVFRAGALGLTATLDPFSAYMAPEELALFEEETGGEYVGIGVEIKITTLGIVIIRVFPQSPAAEMGITPGEQITAIDGVATAGFSLLRAVEMMRGPAGSPVELTIRSQDGDIRDVTMERNAVDVSPFPLYGLAQSGAAYVRWTDFTAGSADRLAAIVEGFSVENPSGLILDLRDNPGGILEEAVSAAGIFLPPNRLVCRLVNQRHRDEVEFRTAPAPSNYAGPVVIVLDEGSASASEVFAAALQEEGRAVVVGRKSFGKGWVQSLFELSDGGALRLSTAHYYTPIGHTFGENRAIAASDSGAADSIWFLPDGIDPDAIVSPNSIGPWQDALASRGAFADFCAQYATEWPADELLGTLRHWCDSAGISSTGAGAELARHIERDLAFRISDSAGHTLTKLISTLKMAAKTDAEFLFHREGPQLLMRLWEQRLLTTVRPDESELEIYLDMDPDLSVARDLLEESDRYNAVTSVHIARLTKRSAHPDPEL